MKPILLWLTVSLVAVLSGAVLGGDKDPATYYVQLVRGNNEDKPPAHGAKPIGPTLSKALRSVYRWKGYWEVSLQAVEVPWGRKTQVQLNQQRAVEIDLTSLGKRKVTARQDGKRLTTTTQPVGRRWTIVGGDRDPASSWFIVVRRDKPSSD